MQNDKIEQNKKKRNNAIAFGIIALIAIIFATSMIKMAVYGVNPNG